MPKKLLLHNSYCGQHIKPGASMTSTKENFLIIIVADDQMIGTGLKARIRFISENYEESDNYEDDSFEVQEKQ